MRGGGGGGGGGRDGCNAFKKNTEEWSVVTITPIWVNLCCIGGDLYDGTHFDTCMALPFSGLSEQTFTVCVALNEGTKG